MWLSPLILVPFWKLFSFVPRMDYDTNDVKYRPLLSSLLLPSFFPLSSLTPSAAASASSP